MGLDMYAYRIPKESVINDFSFGNPDFKFDGEEDVREEIHYWRKHHDLHGWMENLYREKGGEEEFNCAYVRLTLDDLDRLEQDLKGSNLPETVGFFFGDNPPDDESLTDDLKFIQTARNIIESGDAIYYSPWW